MPMSMPMPFTASCEETRELVSDYVEGELDDRPRRRVARHLRMCRRCRAVWQALVATMNGLRALGATEAPLQPAFADSVVARLRADAGDGPPP
jgi:predicted anti-sigma-YlaC factor YlaD